MGGWITCEGGHRQKMLVHEAAIRLSENRLGKCRCGEPLHYYVLHHFANAGGEENNWEVTRVARLYSRRRKDGFDPFLLLLQHEDDHTNRKILPIFWAPDTKHKIRGGQFPPLLSAGDWKLLFRRLNIKM